MNKLILKLKNSSNMSKQEPQAMFALVVVTDSKFILKVNTPSVCVWLVLCVQCGIGYCIGYWYDIPVFVR